MRTNVETVKYKKLKTSLSFIATMQAGMAVIA